MGGTGKKQRKATGDPAKKLPPPTPADYDEEEDGDMATPKRDRTDDEDQPL